MTTASASIDALFHTGTDQSPLGESSEYVLKTLLPAITLLADRAISPAEFAATVSRVADTKADLEDVVGLSKRMENAESRIKTLTEATRSLHAVESQVAELTGAVNLIDTDKINAIVEAINLLEGKLTVLRTATSALALTVSPAAQTTFDTATNG